MKWFASSTKMSICTDKINANLNHCEQIDIYIQDATIARRLDGALDYRELLSRIEFYTNTSTLAGYDIDVR